MEGAPGCHPCREVEKVGGKPEACFRLLLCLGGMSGPSASQAPEDKAGGLGYVCFWVTGGDVSCLPPNQAGGTAGGERN